MKNFKKEKIYEKIMDNPFIGITITDSKGICCYVNHAQQRISGIPEEEVIGKDMVKLAKQNLFSISSSAEVLRRREEVNLHQTSSKGKAYDIKATPVFDDKGQIEYVINYILDVTELYKFKELVEYLAETNKKSHLKYNELLQAHDTMGNLVYYSKKMEKVVALCEKIAASDATVLIVGPSGSGKELVADLICQKSNRKDNPFIKINCAAIPENLLESELFGYEPGAFTGGNPKGKKGLFEVADQGTLLLDEIGEMPVSLQAKLLRVLQDNEVRRIGGETGFHVDVRIIAATNCPLEQLMQEKRFREDLYYRLNVISIPVPALHDRREDIPILIGRFVNVFNQKYGMNKTLRGDAVNYMTTMNYPGNVRELKNLVERLTLQSASEEVTIDDIIEICGPAKNLHRAGLSLDEIEEGVSLKELVGLYEKEILIQCLSVYGKTDAAAEKLQMDRSTLTRKIKKYNL